MCEERLSSIINQMADEMYHDKIKMSGMERRNETHVKELSEAKRFRKLEAGRADSYRDAMLLRDAEIARLKGESESHKELKNCIMEFTNHYHDGLKSDNPTDEQLIEGYKRANEEHNKHKAKSSKLTAEKRKLMELIREEVKGGYTGTIRVLDNYKAWQRAQRKTGK